MIMICMCLFHIMRGGIDLCVVR